MRDYKNVFKALAKEKKNTAADIFQLCLFKAMTAKSALTYEDRVQIAYKLLSRAFTPISNANKLNNGMEPYLALIKASQYCVWTKDEIKGSYYFKQPETDWLDSDSEKEQYKRLLQDVIKKFRAKEQEKYIFIFVNKQLPSKEYMLVQTSHVTFELGNSLRIEGIKTDGLNFVVCGAKSEEHLLEIDKQIRDKGYKTVKFIEPDVNNQTTALASYPIAYRDKSFLREHRILKFE